MRTDSKGKLIGKPNKKLSKYLQKTNNEMSIDCDCSHECKYEYR